MSRPMPSPTQREEPICAACRRPLGDDQGYEHRGRLLCAECAMDRRSPRARKTHWQYLTAIRSQYLQDPRDP